MPVKVAQLGFFKKLFLGAAMLVFRLLGATLRVKATPRALQILKEAPTGHLILLWHNRLALALIAFSRLGRGIPLTGLVSASGDGAILAYIMRAFGIQTARGSSSRRAVEATRELFAALEGGRNIVITPDGPRGPVYQLKEGAAAIGNGHAHGTLLVGLNASGYWQLKSWDRFIVPKPFCTLTVDVEKIDGPMEKEALEKKLVELNG